eukprot:CAMPEP_0177650250 /NCGR_PEP_ID=MMETSP0447-20121125/11837_1 /TAXON_ID=0 /ORGANISM="Stygamoeba regulata, Strain BSH-02190019" /LENGTH=91 /DNA_ID=CAMNT_0019153097 /DNA_START=17 /DNA_END=292 /DNA_ORIENTATION=+
MSGLYSVLSNGHLDVYSRLDGDGGDILDDGARRVQVDNTLVQAHLEAVVCAGTVTTGGLAGGDAQNLGRETDRAADGELLAVSSADEVVRD